MNVPDEVRDELRARIAREAEETGWTNLTWYDKSQRYEDWTRNPEIGGRLARYMDRAHVRVYIKDTLVKPYARGRLAGHERAFRVLGIDEHAVSAATYRMPHGRRLDDGRVIGWGRAAEWKTILMALHERAFPLVDARPFGAVFLEATGRYGEKEVREMVNAAAEHLKVERLIWLET